MNETWLKQSKDEPLFKDLLWSRPENKKFAGKLLIVGGNSHSFTAVNSAFGASLVAGAGTSRAVLPQSLAKTLGRVFPEAEFLPATPSGGFSQKALADLLDTASWADGVLLAGNFGANSETALLLEAFLSKFKGQVTLAGDSPDPLWTTPEVFSDRPETTIVTDLPKLQKLLSGNLLIKNSMDLLQLIEALNHWTSVTHAALVTKHQGNLVISHKGRTATQKGEVALERLAAFCAVWRLQQQAKPFEALTTAAYCSIE